MIRQPKIWMLVCIVGTLISFSTLKAQPWSLQGLGLERTQISELQKKYPQISSEEDLSEVLNSLNQMYPGATLEPYFDGREWIITLTQQPIVDDLRFETMDGLLPPSLSWGLAYLVGQIHSPVLVEKLQKATSQILKKEGYYDHQLKIKTSQNLHKVTLIVQVTLGKRCVVEGVRADFPLPEEAEEILGEYCKRSHLEKFVSSLKEYYHNKNYIENTLEWGKLHYNQKNKRATLELSGTPGPQVLYTFSLHSQAKKNRASEKILEEIREDISAKDYAPYLAVARIQEILKEKDYLFAQVTDPIVTSENSQRKIYAFEIRPAYKVELGSLRLLGVTAMPLERVYQELRTSHLWSLRATLDIQYLDERIKSLEALYQSLGYWDIQILEPEISYHKPTQKTHITLRIEEGRRYVFQSIKFQGAKAFSREKLLEAWNLKEEDPLDQSKVLAFRNQIIALYQEQGYVDVEVQLNFKRTATQGPYQTHVEVKVVEGTRWVIGDVYLFGLHRVHPDVVMRELELKKGEAYSLEKIRNTHSNLLSLGLFQSARLVPNARKDGLSPHLIQDISIILRESEHGWVSYGPGYDFFQGYNYNIEASYDNLLGQGRKLLARLKVDEAKPQTIFREKTLLGTYLSLGYVHPYILESPLDFLLTLSHRAVPAQYWQFSTTVNQTLRYRFKQLKKTSLSVFTEQSLQSEVGSQEQLSYFLAQGDVRIFTAGTTLSFDLSDDPMWPQKGTRWDLSYRRAFYLANFDTRFHKFDVSSSYYHSLWRKNLVAALNLRWTSLWNIGRKNRALRNQTLPLSEMLLTGGNELVRGFSEQLGPYVYYYSKNREGDLTPNKNIIGGTSRIIFKPKLRYMISENFAINLFYDLGNSFLSPDMIRRFRQRFAFVDPNKETRPHIYENPILTDKDFLNPQKLYSQVYSSTGLSLDYLTPIGSLRVSAAYPLHQPHPPGPCTPQTTSCWDRRRGVVPVIGRLKFDLTIAARF